MNVITTPLEGVLIIEPKVHGDARGYFMETYRKDILAQHGIVADFIQDNESKSKRGVLRGLHYQLPPYAQAKLVRVTAGAVYDVAVDLRKGSPTFGRHYGIELSAENKRMFYIPRGFAHGFLVLQDDTVFTYKCDNTYAPAHERSIRYDDPALKIEWPLPASEHLLSEKDLRGALLATAETF